MVVRNTRGTSGRRTSKGVSTGSRVRCSPRIALWLRRRHVSATRPLRTPDSRPRPAAGLTGGGRRTPGEAGYQACTRTPSRRSRPQPPRAGGWGRPTALPSARRCRVGSRLRARSAPGGQGLLHRPCRGRPQHRPVFVPPSRSWANGRRRLTTTVSIRLITPVGAAARPDARRHGRRPRPERRDRRSSGLTTSGGPGGSPPEPGGGGVGRAGERTLPEPSSRSAVREQPVHRPDGDSGGRATDQGAVPGRQGRPHGDALPVGRR